MIIEGNKITAEGDNVLIRISDGLRVGKSISLGYTYYINNKPIGEPLLELPEHYEEVPKTEEEIQKEIDRLERKNKRI